MRGKYILFGAGDDGRRLLNLMNPNEVVAFVDNNKEIVGKEISGIPIYAPEYLLTIADKLDHLSVVISVSEKYQKSIIEQLQNMNINEYWLPSNFLKQIVVTSDSRIKTLQGKFQGKRCFIIGTGPSLTVQDLNKLKEYNEITFASNKIFKIFTQTEWRPLLYCISDIDVFAYYYDQICSLDIPYKFLINMKNTKYEKIDLSKLKGDDKYIFNIFKEDIYDTIKGTMVTKFSTDPDKYVVDGGITVTYSMLQWAYFLGFQEVYLLGVDFNYGDISGKDNMKKDHFCKNYMEKGEVVNNPKLKESLEAYEAAKKFAESHNFKIYNATRGGKLEVFQRVDFDSLFSEVH